jgi:hypothetical protein
MLELAWNEILTAVGGTAALALAAAWLIKSLVGLWLSKDIEAYKQRLLAESQRELTEHKAQLDRINKQLEIRFSVLQAKRAEHLTELYGFIQDAHDHAVALTAAIQRVGLEDQQRRAAAAFESVRTAFREFKKRRLYLSLESAEKVKKLLMDLLDASLPSVGHHRGSYTETEVREAATKFEAKESELDDVLAAIEREFRAILGSETFS